MNEYPFINSFETKVLARSPKKRIMKNAFSNVLSIFVEIEIVRASCVYVCVRDMGSNRYVINQNERERER